MSKLIGVVIAMLVIALLSATGYVGYEIGHSDGYSEGYNRGSVIGCEVGTDVTAIIFQGYVICVKQHCDCPGWDSWAAFSDDCLAYEDAQDYLYNNPQAAEIYKRWEMRRNSYPVTCKTMTISS